MATTGIVTRHHRKCPSRAGGECGKPCKPYFEAWVYSAAEDKKIRKTFPTLSAAKAWRADATSALNKGTLRAPTRKTVRVAWEDWIEGARAGTIRTRSGDTYKPSALRAYEGALTAKRACLSRLDADRSILDELGAARLGEIHRVHLQDLADKLVAGGLDASTIRNAIMPLRAIYRRAVARGDVGANPTSGLELPAVRGRRDRIADPGEAARLIAALPEADRALWATAFYAGLRRGELYALRWEDVDLATGRLRIEQAYDPVARVFGEPKSRAGKRAVPIVPVLRDYLMAHRMQSERTSGLVFGSGTVPFDYDAMVTRARKAWKAAGFAPIGLHEARHTFASLMIAAGVNVKAISTYMGHSSIAITYDRYGHLMPGNEDEAAALLDAYLARADTAARLAQID